MITPDALDGNFRTFFDAWASFRSPGETLPRWSDFRPAPFGSLLAEISLVQRHERGKYIYCLLGSDLDDRLGFDSTGLNQLDLLAPRVRDFVTDWFEAIMQVPCGAYSDFSIELRNSQDMSIKSLSLPLLDEGGVANWFLYFHDAGQAYAGLPFGELISFGDGYVKMRPVDLGAGVETDLAQEF